MPKLRLVTFVLLTATVLVASYLLLRSQGLLGPRSPTALKPVSEGHQEIVFLGPATTSEAWERLVAAVKSLVEKWPTAYPNSPPLIASFDRAFLNLTADVPEVSLHFRGHEEKKLWFRWYKLSSESTCRTWIENLAQRLPPPLAIIGGDNTDRAYSIARDLEEFRGKWQGAPPLFLITTATADRVYPDAFADPNPKDPESYPKLTEVYPDATYRFSFTNARMAEAVIDLVLQRPDLWPAVPPSPVVAGGMVGQGQPFGGLCYLFASGTLRPMSLTAAAWADDPYPRDLAERFPLVFKSVCCVESIGYSIAYGVGDFDQPNFYEYKAVGKFFEDHRPDYNQLLLLPTNAQRARRFLRDLYRRNPSKIKNVVVVSGDSISFNNVYRDHDVVWNFLDLPVPLLFFSHRNPVDEAAGFGKTSPETGRASKTGTQDLLLYRDIVTSLVQCGMPNHVLSGDSRLLGQRLQQVEWRKGYVFHPDYVPRFADDPPGTRGVPLFDDEGNRRPRTGERVVLFKPDLSVPKADISFWGRINDPASQSWRQLGKTLTLLGRPRAHD